MSTDSRSWRRAVVLVGLAYVAIGLGFAQLPGRGARLAAWAGSAIIYLLHIRYELKGERPAGVAALHTALAAALGACGLAVGATIHAVATATFRGAYGVALVAWPVLTGLPAFAVAWLIASLVARRG